MSVSEYLFIAFFIGIALFTVFEAIRNPLLAKRLYRDINFVDRGKQQLAVLSASELVKGMYTDSLNSGVIDGTTISQCKAWSVNRRQFTLSKASRNRNKAAWSVTVVTGGSPVTFRALPTIVPEAIAYIGDDASMEFPGDDQLSSRYHVVADQPDQLRSVFTGEIRDFLLESEIIFIEQTATELVLKRKWNDEKIAERLQREMDTAVSLHKRLAGKKTG